MDDSITGDLSDEYAAYMERVYLETIATSHGQDTARPLSEHELKRIQQKRYELQNTRDGIQMTRAAIEANKIVIRYHRYEIYQANKAVIPSKMLKNLATRSVSEHDAIFQRLPDEQSCTLTGFTDMDKKMIWASWREMRKDKHTSHLFDQRFLIWMNEHVPSIRKAFNKYDGPAPLTSISVVNSE